MKYEAWDESGCRITIEAESARDAAREYVEGGDWGESNSTMFHRIHVALDGEVVDTVTVTTDPAEPPCESTTDGHEWHEADVRGNGGGVVVTETCTHCGVRKITDTWATNPCNGTQGHTSVRYEPAD